MGGTNPYLYGLDRYRVTARAVVATTDTGGAVYVYRGAMLPVGTLPSQVDHMLRLGLIEKVQVA